MLVGKQLRPILADEEMPCMLLLLYESNKLLMEGGDDDNDAYWLEDDVKDEDGYLCGFEVDDTLLYLLTPWSICRAGISLSRKN